MMAVAWERTKMLSSLEASDFFNAAYSVDGIISDAVETAIRDDMVEAIVELNLCSWCLMPPAKKQQPRTKRIFDRMDPSILD